MIYLVFTGFMKIVLLVLFLQINISNGIIGGYWKSIKNHPYLVAIIYERPQVCCGSIIMASWVLTAARCVHRSQMGINGVKGVKVGATTFDDDNDGDFVMQKTIHVHPHFMCDASYALTVNDIAIIQLKKIIEFGPHVHPIPIAFQHLLHNSSCLTMGWGLVNPRVYLTGNIQNAEFAPTPGKNYLRDISQQATNNMTRCQDVMRKDFKDAIHKDYHICALHYPVPIRYHDPVAGSWSGKYKRDDNFHINRTKQVRRQSKGNWVNGTYIGLNPTWPHYIYHGWLSPWTYWTVRVNTDGPSYFDYGAPLMCYGQQVGIFAFPVANVKLWRPAARAVYTVLPRYLDWIDTEIEMELDRQANIPPPKPEIHQKASVWDDLSSSKLICCSKSIVGIMLVIVIVIHEI